MSDLDAEGTELLPATRGRVPVVVPSTADEQLSLAQRIIESGLAPSGYKTPAAVVVGLQMGSELGMLPMQSLRFINVIQGRPTLNADGCGAVVMASGKAEYFYPEEQTAERATFVTKRRGAPGPVRSTFTMEDAVAAGLPGKNPNYKLYPARMLAARCKSFLARDVYPDVVGGILTTEEAMELDDPPPPPDLQPREITTTATAAAAGPSYIDESKRRGLFALAKEHAKTHEQIKEHLATLGIGSTTRIPVDQYDAVCTWIRGEATAA